MAEIPLRNAALLANPTLNADPRRYSTADYPNINRVVSRLRYFLPLVPIKGRYFEVRGHDPNAQYPDAEFYNNEECDHGVTPINAERGYIPAHPEMTGPSRQIALKHLASRVDIRDFSTANLGEFYPELEFQRKAIEHAVWSLWEKTIICGDTDQHNAEFEGLKKLSETPGAGQKETVYSHEYPLADLDRSIQRVKADNGIVDLLVMNEAAERALVDQIHRLGCRPDYQSHSKFERLLHYGAIPICRSDHVPNVKDDKGNYSTTIYVLRVGVPNGVFPITSEESPGLQSIDSRDREPPFLSVQASLYSALVSTTDDALVALEQWPVEVPIEN